MTKKSKLLKVFTCIRKPWQKVHCLPKHQSLKHPTIADNGRTGLMKLQSNQEIKEEPPVLEMYPLQCLALVQQKQQLQAHLTTTIKLGSFKGDHKSHQNHNLSKDISLELYLPQS
ncbi:hypothetical protein GW17_00043572 [Ensete ventricosum]|nr:hypothetical protein GW17_00043572 [Ensete ventricosum]RZS14198.1 hypothetical protein BHM03_00045856 [Ensete ventricosum]